MNLRSLYDGALAFKERLLPRPYKGNEAELSEIFGSEDEMVGKDEGDSGTADWPSGEE